MISPSVYSKQPRLEQNSYKRADGCIPGVLSNVHVRILGTRGGVCLQSQQKQECAHSSKAALSVHVFRTANSGLEYMIPIGSLILDLRLSLKSETTGFLAREGRKKNPEDS